MINRLLSALGIRVKNHRPDVSDSFDEVATAYINLVRSRVIGAIVVEEERITPSCIRAEFRYGLLVSLCAYFTARTDLELELRGVPDEIREYVWSCIPDFVIEEMNFAGRHKATTRKLILHQTGLFRGVFEKHGHSNVAAIAKSIATLADSQADGRDQRLQRNIEWLEPGLEKLLSRYERYLPRLDKLASEVR